MNPDSADNAEGGECDGSAPLTCEEQWMDCLASLADYDSYYGTNWYADCSVCADTCAQNPEVPELTENCMAAAYNIGSGECPDPCGGGSDSCNDGLTQCDADWNIDCDGDYYVDDASLCAYYVNYVGYDCATVESYAIDCSALDACGGCDADSDACTDAGGNTGWVGDGYCDSSNNQEACGYDGGDCCPCDCEDATYSCDTYGGTNEDCVDPNGSVADVVCWDGSLVCSEEECSEEPEGCADGETEVTVVVDGGSWQSEISWDFNGVVGYAPSTTYFCLADGDYTFTGCDAYGDGWNGNTADFYVDGSLIATWSGPDSALAADECESVTVTIGGGEVVSGCTDPSAPEYNADATLDDGSCWAACEGVPSWINDGYCDLSNNTEGCLYDGGDCCPGDCDDTGANNTSGWTCEDNGGDCTTCVDPDSADLAEGGQCAGGYCGDLDCSDDEDCATCPADCGVCPWDAEITGLTVVGTNYEDSYGDLYPAISAAWDALLDGTSCEENNQITCWDGTCADSEDLCSEDACADCEFDWTDYGSACCDTAWDEYGINCGTLEANYGWDCSGCSCPGDVACSDLGQVECWDGSCADEEALCPEYNPCAGNISWLGDGYCDSINNNEDCGWDYGDCCPGDCDALVADGCPENTAGCYSTISCGDCTTCLDPNSYDVLEGECSEGGRDEGDFTYTPRAIDESDFDNTPDIAINVMTGEITYSDDYVATRDVSYEVTFACDTCGFDENGYPDGSEWSGVWATSSPEFTVYGFELGDDVCVTVVGISTELGVTDSSDPVCALAGEEIVEGCTDSDAVNYNADANVDDGTCEYCTTGDANEDGVVNVTDIVTIVNFILDGGSADTGCLDANGDGTVNVTDIVTVVNYILGGGSLSSASGQVAQEAVIVIADNNLSIESEGAIKGVQLLLSHGPDFKIDLVDREGALEVSEQRPLSESATIVVVAKEHIGFLGTTTGDYKIVDHVVVNALAKDIVATTQDVRGASPVAYEVKAAYPNPFNPSTTLEIALPEAGYLSVKIYNLVGQEVAVLSDGFMQAGGNHQLVWNADNMSSGVYLARIEGFGQLQTQKLMLLK